MLDPPSYAGGVGGSLMPALLRRERCSAALAARGGPDEAMNPLSRDASFSTAQLCDARCSRRAQSSLGHRSELLPRVEALYGLPIYAGRRTYIRGKARIYRLEGGEEGHVNIGGTILALRLT